MKNAMSGTVWNACERSILELFRRRAHYLPNLETSHDAVMKLFIRPDHINTCFQCVDIGLFNKETRNVTLRISDSTSYICQSISIKHSPFAIPQYAGDEFHTSDPEAVELLRQIRAYEDAYSELKTTYSNCRGVLEYMNRTAGNLQTIRFFWPAIVTLMSMDGNHNDKVERLREQVVPARIPLLQHDVRELLQETSTELMAASLLPAPEKARNEAVEVGIRRSDEPSIKFFF